jgi:hypothetical protein
MAPPAPPHNCWFWIPSSPNFNLLRFSCDEKPPMAPPIWYPYRFLNITARDSYGMHCVGHTARHQGSRCRWDIPTESFNRIRSILDEMETKPPSDAYILLQRLAWLGLCEQYHQNQANRMVLEWSQAIDDAAKEYGKFRGPQEAQCGSR